MAQRIKGYLPLRIQLDDSPTFLYIKEHSNDTLFVTNCPVYPNVNSETLLRNILGRYSDLDRVAMTGNPRRQSELTTFDKKFAHVTYKSAKDLKTSMQTFCEIMSSDEPMIVVDKVELQTLQDEQDDDFVEDQPPMSQLEGIHAVVARYRQSIPDRNQLLADCNAIMEEYEAEVAARAKKPVVDEDGFITVSYSKNSTRDEAMEMDLSDKAGRATRKSSSRSRKKRKKEPLKDFYRFQTKEHRKNAVQELRERFEQDLAKAKELKDRPF